MKDLELNELLRKLPAIHELVDKIADGIGTPATVLTACRNVLENERAYILEGKKPQTSEKLHEQVLIELNRITQSSMRNVINATGVILHTALGRACMPGSAVEAVSRTAQGYSVLEWDCETGRRGHRDIHTERLICKLAGSEAATIANNNAGATLLVLSALASGREVIVSRGQLVEIGGSFRIPDVMNQSGAVMHEVGCTNRTHLRDYREAINENTAIILRVHPSNYRIKGFTGEVSLDQLVELGEEFGIPVVSDLGAGSYIDLSKFGLPSEPTVQSSIEAGAAVVTSSGDKLIGGPQAGIITGRKEYIQKIRKHPLARALRVGKLTIAALEASLMLFRESIDYIADNHPLYMMFAADVDELRTRADEFLTLLILPGSCSVSVLETDSYVGSGALPDHAVPSVGVGLSSPDNEVLARKLRLGNPAVASRIEDGLIKLDMRTLQPGELNTLASLVNSALQELWA